MSTFVLVLLALVVVFLFYTVLAPTLVGLPRFMRTFRLACPHHPAVGRVRLDGARAALTSAYGAPSLRVARCSLLRPGDSCDQACVEELKEA